MCVHVYNVTRYEKMGHPAKVWDIPFLHCSLTLNFVHNLIFSCSKALVSKCPRQIVMHNAQTVCTALVCVN